MNFKENCRGCVLDTPAFGFRLPRGKGFGLGLWKGEVQGRILQAPSVSWTLAKAGVGAPSPRRRGAGRSDFGLRVSLGRSGGAVSPLRAVAVPHRPPSSQPRALQGHWGSWAWRGLDAYQPHSPVARLDALPTDPARVPYCSLNPFIQGRIQCISERGTPSGENRRARLREAGVRGAAGTQAGEGDCAVCTQAPWGRGVCFDCS